MNVHIDREFSKLKLSKDENILTISITQLEDGDLYITIVACPLNLYPDANHLKKIKKLRVKFKLINIPIKTENIITNRFKTYNENSVIIKPKVFKLSECKEISTFQINNEKEIYIMITPDDEFYYEKLKNKKLKFSEDLQIT